MKKYFKLLTLKQSRIFTAETVTIYKGSVSGHQGKYFDIKNLESHI